jgi:hypothetical protein
VNAIKKVPWVLMLVGGPHDGALVERGFPPDVDPDGLLIRLDDANYRLKRQKDTILAIHPTALGLFT